VQIYCILQIKQQQQRPCRQVGWLVGDLTPLSTQTGSTVP